MIIEWNTTTCWIKRIILSLPRIFLSQTESEWASLYVTMWKKHIHQQQKMTMNESIAWNIWQKGNKLLSETREHQQTWWEGELRRRDNIHEDEENCEKDMKNSIFIYFIEIQRASGFILYGVHILCTYHFHSPFSSTANKLTVICLREKYSRTHRKHADDGVSE